VIGYEGNDGSLMGFLQDLPEHIPDRVLWCVYAPDAKPRDCVTRVSPEVRDYVRGRRGRFIPIQGFDELMAKLLSRLGEKGSIPDLYERLKERARQRERSYDDQQRSLFKASVPSRQPHEGSISSPAPRNVDRALSKAVGDIAATRKDKPWWIWYEEARTAPDADTKEAILRQALEAHPDNATLLGEYASFLNHTRKNPDKAEEFYQRAVAAEPTDALALSSYAWFLERYRKDIDKAEEYYQRAVEATPQNVSAPAFYAKFLQGNREDMDKAEEYYQRAVEATPQDADTLRLDAEFLRAVRRNTKKADELEQRAQSIEGG
jgi:tetratricopeptide (TPR) repeat protein